MNEEVKDIRFMNHDSLLEFMQEHGVSWDFCVSNAVFAVSRNTIEIAEVWIKLADLVNRHDQVDQAMFDLLRQQLELAEG